MVAPLVAAAAAPAALTFGDFLIGLGPSVIGAVGAFFSGESNAEALQAQLDLKSKEIDAMLTNAAENRKVQREKLKQDWDAFIEDLKFRRETQEFKNVFAILQPEIEQQRRQKNILKAFSGRAGMAPQATVTQSQLVGAPAAAPAVPAAVPTIQPTQQSNVIKPGVVAKAPAPARPRNVFVPESGRII